MKKTRVGRIYGNTFAKLIPEYGVLSLITCLVVNGIVYWGSHLIMKDSFHYDFTSQLDRRIPFIKEWVVIYLLCYIFWVINYVLIAREGREHWFRFAFADYLSRIICAFFFLLLPTTNIRPEVPGEDIFSRLMRLVYSLDAPTNLFPSIHCLASWLCFVGIRNSKKIPFWYKVFSCIFAILVLLSTQFTKQHYLIDIFGGVLIAELCCYIGRHTQIYKYIENLFWRVSRMIFGEETDDE